MVNAQSSKKHVGAYADAWLEVAPKAILAFYIAELLLNRIMFRILIFIPYGEAQDALGSVVTALGVTSMNFTVIASIITLAALTLRLERFKYIPAVIAVFALFDYIGWAKLYWTLPLVSAYIIAVDPRRALEAAFLALLTLESMIVDPVVARVANAAWIILPVAVIAQKRGFAKKWVLSSIPFAALSLLFVAGNTYIAGQVLIFALGLLNPWLLPPSIILYTATGSPGLLSLLLTGPSLQISSQVLVISSIYILELGRRER